MALIRKACHFDGLLSGRFELLIRVQPDVLDDLAAEAMARNIFNIGVAVRGYDKGKVRSLGDASPALAWLWGKARVKRDPKKPAHVRAGRPFAIIENGNNLGPIEAGATAGARLKIVQGPKAFELFLIYPEHDDPSGRMSLFRQTGRTIRTYLLKLLQDVETISQLCELDQTDLGSDLVQSFLNEYTRHIVRGKQAIASAPDALVDYCYSAFARLYPGRIDGLRAQIAASAMRPNIKRKLIHILDDVAAAATVINNVFGDKVMGDKFENNTISGQGVALGRGARASVNNSTNNQGLDPELISGITALAKAVRDTGRSDANIEAEVIDAAAKKAEEGDENGVVAYLGKAAKWTFDLASSVGSSALNAFLKAKLGI